MSLSGHDIHMSLKPLPGAEAALAELAAQARRDLAALAHPAAEWVRPLPEIAGRDVRDVVIVGAGQAGLVVGLALKREGVHDVLLLDRNPAGYEGPWDTFARMEVLRTPKTLVGAELGIPSLSAKSWFEAVYGAEAWEQITWIPRRDWMRYLRWYRTIAALDIRNDIEVTGIAPEGRLLRIKTGDGPVLARRIVICTGHDAGGQWAVPEMVSEALPEQVYAHSNGPVDFAAMKGLRIGILGHGGSAFDAGLTALAAGAASVDLCFRRARLPVVNPHRWLEWSAFLAHYRDLDDRTRWNIGRYFDIEDQPPPRHTYDRARAEPRLKIHGNCPWRKIAWNGETIEVATEDRHFTFDRVVCATGVRNGLEQRPELQGIASDIALWSDRYTPPPEEAHAELGKLPYLGHHFEFLEKRPGAAPWLANIFAFNFSGMVSMGPVASSITGHRFGVPRVVRGITSSLFLEQEVSLLPSLRAFAEPEIDPAAATMYSGPPALAADGC
ncbi:MAG TPA: NAD(P)/FAD-dependent oxidoreductase [Stellaceae bacterium]|nr:NAD(P)/FAD-dependent oxidoreductase [Stellaceae bacterium]